MKLLLLCPLVMFSLAVSVFAAPKKENAIPPEVEQALQAPEKVVLYSLEPWDRSEAAGEKLRNFKVLGHTPLDQTQAKVAAEEFRTAVAHWDGLLASCFDPRHALQITFRGHTYDLLLCYSCHYLYIYREDKFMLSLGVAGSPKVLNGLLAAANVELSKTDSEEDREARHKKSEASWKRWQAAMPKSIVPLWKRAMKDELQPNIAPLREALGTEFPGIRERILALFTWYGSGDGPWSGFPSYEIAAEELLLEFPTPDLIRAAETEPLSEAQLEGIARLLGGWDFSQRRPKDLATVPPALKSKLLAHTLKSTDDDKLGRAKKAFSPPQ